MSDERRRFTRIPIGITAELSYQGEIYPVNEVDDLSMGGCQLTTEGSFDPGEECEVSIMLTGSADEIRVQINGEINRDDENHVSIKFLNLDSESYFHLQRIIMFNSSDPGKIENEIRDNRGIA